MAKAKNKKNAGKADKFHANASQNKNKKKLNPFEVHINREKFKVLGKKSKTDRGLPGVSRAKAMKKRKNTIGFEMKLVNKTNTFLDKRIGEKNNKLTEEEKIMARFAAERIQQHKTKATKESIYNLADDEILTHKGHTLEEIEKFDDPRSDDEDDDGFNMNIGNLGDNFVSDANFGGGVLSKSDHKDGAMSRKDIIEQLIVDSKKRKLEKQKLKEETLELTEKLDSDWKDLHVILSQNSNKDAPVDSQPSIIDKLLSANEKKNENYDKTMRELKFAPRGTPSNRLKSEDEIAKIEKENLEKLEEDRLARMKGIIEVQKTKINHRSADALDDGYEIDSDPDVTITYDKEGIIMLPKSADKLLDKQSKKISNASNEEDDNDAGESSDNQDSEEEGSANDDDESDADSLDDLRESDSELSDDEKSSKTVEKKRKISETTTMSQKKNKVDDTDQSCSNEKATNESTSKIKEDLMARKAIMEKAASELPYTYEMPQSYEELMELLKNQSPDHQSIIIERIIKCNHPKLGEGNKEKLGIFFIYLLQYINDIFHCDNLSNEADIVKSFKCFERILPFYYDLAIMDPVNSGNSVLQVIEEKFDDYKKSAKDYPGIETLVFFKLVSFLFPTSDFKHPVVTPCFIMISEILSNAKISSTVDVSKGLFLTTLLLDYTSLSKRYMPAALNFIQNVLFLCVSPVKKMRIKPMPPLKHPSSYSNLLVLSTQSKEENSNILPKMKAEDLLIEQDNERFKISCLLTATKIFYEFVQRATDINAQEPMFEVHMQLLDLITLSNYPENVAKAINNMKSDIENTIDDLVLQPLREAKKPKMLKLYEPSVENNFTGKKKMVMSKEKVEHEKLLYKYRKEMKGALREIRRDKSFISSVKIKDKIKSDNIRKEKVKQIYSEASVQQGELKAFERLKKKKK